MTKKIFQQEIINMKNESSNRSSSSSRESSVGLEMSHQPNNNNAKQRHSPKKVSSISNSSSSSSVNSLQRVSTETHQNQNSNTGSPTSLQNFLNKFNNKDKSPSPNSNIESKSFLGKLSEIKTSFVNHNNKVGYFFMHVYINLFSKNNIIIILFIIQLLYVSFSEYRGFFTFPTN